MTAHAPEGLVLGVDSSTSATKVELRELVTGAVVGRARAPHPPTAPPVSEQHPDRWWEALVAAVASLGPLRSRVVAVAVAAQQHGLVVLGADGRPLRPAKLWNDTTSAEHAGRLVHATGPDWWAARCGSVPVASFTVSKLAWLREHEPDVHAAICCVMLPHDHLTWRLTGDHVTDRGDASGTGWWGPAGYDPEILELVALDPTALPTVRQADEPAGRLTPGAAAALGLPAGIVVAPGTGDNMAAALGLGLGAGDVVVSLGTSGTVFTVSESPTADGTGEVAGFADASGRYLPLVCTLNATKVTATVAGWLGTDPEGLGELALTALPDDQPVLVPYLDGERTPDLPHAAGVLTGLRSGTSRAGIAAAAFEGVLCGLLDGRDSLTAAGAATDGRLLLVGGGARSPAYRCLLAELVGGPVEVPAVEEAAAAGACVQAAGILAGEPFDRTARRWGLTGTTVVGPRPGVDRSARRARYADARALVLEQHRSVAAPRS